MEPFRSAVTVALCVGFNDMTAPDEVTMEPTGLETVVGSCAARAGTVIVASEIALELPLAYAKE